MWEVVIGLVLGRSSSVSFLQLDLGPCVYVIGRRTSRHSSLMNDENSKS